MNKFFRPNLDRSGRMARGVIGGLCLIAGVIVAGDDVSLAIGLVLVGAGLFAIFEAISKWCVLRACGIKTKL
ncbi:MAG TPA: hypothetical protein VFV23_14500 [Verrucomicrobiae bacterium]|nr:hypothetical protein [Verrucomicrobiae bacterium]